MASLQRYQLRHPQIRTSADPLFTCGGRFFPKTTTTALQLQLPTIYCSLPIQMSCDVVKKLTRESWLA